jgi:tetratricopeptide (TPR) repeat protein
MMGFHKFSILIIFSMALVSCTKSVQPQEPVQVSPSTKQIASLPKTPPAKKVIKKEPRRIPETDPQLAVIAQKKIKRAKKLYSTGEYDKAEILLKESITAFPFLAQAQLTLGKIFLIKGSATRDMALLNSARLMFEMARAIDPGQAEVQTLLELFTVQYPE